MFEISRFGYPETYSHLSPVSICELDPRPDPNDPYSICVRTISGIVNGQGTTYSDMDCRLATTSKYYLISFNFIKSSSCNPKVKLQDKYNLKTSKFYRIHIKTIKCLYKLH